MRLFEVDVFATAPFTGNPLAVIVDDKEELDAATMQRIASWTTFPETTFLLPPTDPSADYRVRIFTPVEEYPFAGHPTLGTAHVWRELGGTPGEEGVIRQQCGLGVVDVRVEPVDDDDAVLAFAAPDRRRTGPLEDEVLDRILTVLELEPQDVVAHEWGTNGPEWAMVQLSSADEVRQRDMSAIGTDLRVGVVGLEQAREGGTASTSPTAAYEVRALTPRHEDPATGSLHASVAQWLRGRGLVPPRYSATQGSRVGRAAEVHVTDDGQRIWIGGRAVTRVRGDLDVR